MNSKSLYYFVEAAKDMNFTQTAKRLYISQQALSQHISKLETQYEVSLFDRKPQLALSYAGQTLLPYAERLLYEEQLIQDMLMDIADQEHGALRVSVTLPRCRCFLPQVVTNFKNRYPQVTLDIITPSTTSALNMVINGDCNIAIGMLRMEHPELEMIKLIDDSWYLLVPDALLHKEYTENQIEEILSAEKVTLSMLSKLPIIVGNQWSNPNGTILGEIVGSETTLNALFSSSSPQNFPEFALEGISMVIVSKMALHNYRYALPAHVHVLSLGNRSSPYHTSAISLAYNKTRHVPAYCEYFIKLVTDYFEEYKKTRD